jgi:hypothetical protein
MAGRGRKNADEGLGLLLAAGKTVQEAAQTAGISERTAHRRLDDPAFRRLVVKLRGEMVARATGRLSDAAVKAVDTLVKLLDADSDSARLGAARSILELGTRLREAVEIEERLNALEQKAANGEFSKSPFATRK